MVRVVLSGVGAGSAQMPGRRVEKFRLSFLQMDIRQLRYFAALAEELHFHRAAARLHIAQPALSQQIRSLEHELGLQLFERTNRRVALTDAGAHLLTEAAAVIARFEEAVETMQRVRAGELGTLRIGVFPGPLGRLLPEILAELRRRNAEVEVATRYLPARDQVTAVLEGRLDLALLPSLSAPHTPAPLVGKVIDRRPLGVAVPAGHALAKKRRLAPRDLDGLPLVWMARASDPSVYDAVLAALTAAGVRPRSLLESSTPESSLSIVAAGLGVSVKTEAEVVQARAAAEEVVWKPLAGFEVKLLTVAAWHPDRVTAALSSLLEVLDRYVIDHATA